jgi:hypothetical protein
VQLGDGLFLRAARVDDGAELADFNGAMHADADLPAPALAEWTRDLFDVPHPTFRPDRDVTVVEDTATGRIVSALFLIPQDWSYGPVSVKAGQPELIATHPEYRNRGLIRAQFEVIHGWSRAGGQLFQLISGIAWFYRQFGYSYAVDLPPRPVIWLSRQNLPGPPDVGVRPATPADVPFLAAVEAQQPSGTVLGPRRGEAGFALELARRPQGMLAIELLVIERPAGGRPIGYVAHTRRLRDGLVSLRALEVRRGESWLAPTAAVISHLQDWLRRHPGGPGRGVRLALPDGHPAIRSLATRVGSGPPGSYGLYLRVPEPAALLRAVAPVLESRLAASPATGWSGELRVDLYTGGLHLRCREGRLEAVDDWTPKGNDEPSADVSIPADDFLRLVFGSRSIADVERATADCLLKSDAAALLLDVLFPPMPTSSWEYC